MIWIQGKPGSCRNGPLLPLTPLTCVETTLPPIEPFIRLTGRRFGPQRHRKRSSKDKAYANEDSCWTSWIAVTNSFIISWTPSFVEETPAKRKLFSWMTLNVTKSIFEILLKWIPTALYVDILRKATKDVLIFWASCCERETTPRLCNKTRGLKSCRDSGRLNPGISIYSQYMPIQQG